MEPLAVDVREAARLTAVSPYTIRRYIQRGTLRAVRIGRRVLVPFDELERLVRGPDGQVGQRPRTSGLPISREESAHV